MDNLPWCNYSSDNPSSYAYASGLDAWNADSSSTHLYFNGCYGSPIDNYLYSGNHGASGWSGLTTVLKYGVGSCTGGIWNQVVQEQVDLNTYYTNNIGGNYGYDDSARQSVATHELGHVAGLAHSTPGISTVMNYSDYRWFTYHIKTPQTDDINGVNYIHTECPKSG